MKKARCRTIFGVGSAALLGALVTACSSSAESARLAKEVSQLRTEVSALSAKLPRLDRPPPSDQELRTAAVAREETLRKMLGQTPVDRKATEEVQAKLNKILATEKDKAGVAKVLGQLVEVQCSGALCRLVTKHETANAYHQFISAAFLEGDGEPLTKGNHIIARIDRTPPDAVTAFIFLERYPTATLRPPPVANASPPTN